MGLTESLVEKSEFTSLGLGISGVSESSRSKAEMEEGREDEQKVSSNVSVNSGSRAFETRFHGLRSSPKDSSVEKRSVDV